MTSTHPPWSVVRCVDGSGGECTTDKGEKKQLLFVDPDLGYQGGKGKAWETG